MSKELDAQRLLNEHDALSDDSRLDFIRRSYAHGSVVFWNASADGGQTWTAGDTCASALAQLIQSRIRNMECEDTT